MIINSPRHYTLRDLGTDVYNGRVERKKNQKHTNRVHTCIMMALYFIGC